MSTTPVRLQNLRDFTVQIRNVRTNEIVGTGIVISTSGKIVTCAHVVVAAGVNPRHGFQIPSSWQFVLNSIFGPKLGPASVKEQGEVGVYFPQARGLDVKTRRARVAATFSDNDDDVVLLELLGGDAPLGPEQIAILGTAENSEGHSFHSYGYRRLENYIAGRAAGTIQGSVEPPSGRTVIADPVQLQSAQINHGMSGAPVLDVERNLVVGIVAETWFPDRSSKDRDTAWAVDARVLTMTPFHLPVREEQNPLRATSRHSAYVGLTRAATAAYPEIAWNNAPPSLNEWVGRKDLLAAINADWKQSSLRMTSLIGFGGEGKSSLARRWIDDLLKDNSQPRPRGVFWWSFSERPNLDEFFEAALAYISYGQVDPQLYPSSSAKAHVIAAMLSSDRYVFVLDGLEVLQHLDGDAYGLLKSGDLRAFLAYFATPSHSSFCLVTSRVPLFDLQEFTTFVQHDVDRLSIVDGRELLQKLRIRGQAAELDRVVADWDGHALTLSLLASYLLNEFEGSVTHIGEVPPPSAFEPPYERVHRVLQHYDLNLTKGERALLMVFSAFRAPVASTAFARVFRSSERGNDVAAPLSSLSDSEFNAIVKRLVNRRLLRQHPQTGFYTAHPLIHSHYSGSLGEGDPDRAQMVHRRIKDYYLSISPHPQYHPTLDNLGSLIEAVYHACRAGATDEALTLYWERLNQGDRFVIHNELGAYETSLPLLREFFPNGDSSQEPQVTNVANKNLILTEVGMCCKKLGRLSEAVSYYVRAVSGFLREEIWSNAGAAYQNLTDLYAHLGFLPKASEAVREAISLARRALDRKEERDALARKGWIDNLRGHLADAAQSFELAELIERELNSSIGIQYLYSIRGIFHCQYLHRVGKADYSRLVADANLRISKNHRWPDDLALSHVALGNLDANAGQYGSARLHFDEAVKAARSISDRPTLIQVLLGRGLLATRQSEVSAAQGDLEEALDYALAGNYRLFEVDIRIALAWAHISDTNAELAQAEAERARQMSEEMGYHWGQIDATAVLASITN